MIVLAISCHPDDIEFQMAGTLLLLRDAGCRIHYFNIANGSAGTTELEPQEIVAKRRGEAVRAAGHLGATFHDSIVDDLEVFYTQDLIRRVTAIVRSVKPDMVLTLSVDDYMEDHMSTARIAIAATFARGIRNFRSIPDEPPVLQDAMLYHSLPHILTDWVRRPLVPEFFVDVTTVIDRKEAMLACHESQKDWLDRSQGLDSYLATMRDNARKAGAMSGRFSYAEGWRRHSHVGFTREDGNPLCDMLGDFCHFPVKG